MVYTFQATTFLQSGVYATYITAMIILHLIIHSAVHIMIFIYS